MPVKGADAFVARLQANKKRLPEDVRKIVRSEGAAMQAQAKRLERVDTGHWRRETDLKVTGNAFYSSATVTANALTDDGFNYGYVQEFGGKYISANSALRTAFFTHSMAALKRLRGLM